MPAVSEPRKACKNSKKAWEKFSRPFGTHVAAANGDNGSPLNLDTSNQRWKWKIHATSNLAWARIQAGGLFIGF